MKKNSFIMVGILNIVLVFGVLFMGCASTGPAGGSSAPLDPQLVGIWLHGAGDEVIELTLRPDNTGTLVTYPINGDKGLNAAMQIRDGGKTLILSANGKKISGRIEEGKYILTNLVNVPLKLSKAQTFEATGSTWAFTNPEVSFTYIFANNGTYKMESTGGGAQMDLARALLKRAGVDGTGTYSVSDYKVTLKPTGGSYMSLDSGGIMRSKTVETYTAMFVDGAFYLEGVFYKKAQ